MVWLDKDAPGRFRLVVFRRSTVDVDLGKFAGSNMSGLTIPPSTYLIRHRGHFVLFDAGLRSEFAIDLAGRLGKNEPRFRHEPGSNEGFGLRLDVLGIDPCVIDAVVLSHLSLGRAGADDIEHEPNALAIVNQRELAATDPANQPPWVKSPQAFSSGHTAALINAEFDLFGDGRVLIFPMPDHASRGQLLAIRSPNGDEIVLAADACYLCRTLVDEQLSSFSANFAQQLDSLRELRSHTDAAPGNSRSNDPTFWAALPAAPKWILEAIVA